MKMHANMYNAMICLNPNHNCFYTFLPGMKRETTVTGNLLPPSYLGGWTLANYHSYDAKESRNLNISSDNIECRISVISNLLYTVSRIIAKSKRKRNNKLFNMHMGMN